MQRIYLISTVAIGPSGNRRVGEFLIQGNTDAVYTVLLDERDGISCTCPDHTTRGNFCKHCLFVVLRVLSVPFDHVARLVEDSSEIGDNCPVDTVIRQALFDFNARGGGSGVQQAGIDTYHTRAVDAVAAAQNNRRIENSRTIENNRRIDNKQAAVEVAQRPILEDDQCAICFENLLSDGGGHAELLVYCQYRCGQSLHAICFEKWSLHGGGKKASTCVYCRAPW